jgi:hypothetical protein
MDQPVPKHCGAINLHDRDSSFLAFQGSFLKNSLIAERFLEAINAVVVRRAGFG